MIFNPIQTNTMPFKAKIKNLLWLIINSTFFRFTPPMFRIFKLYRVFLVKLFGGNIKWSCYLHPTTKIEYPWNLSMGELSSLGERSWIYALDRINIGEKCCIGKNVNLITGSHDINKSTFDLIIRPIKIGDCTWIATGATILPNVSIGNFCVIAANSTVTKNVIDNTVVGGNPAKYIKDRVIKD